MKPLGPPLARAIFQHSEVQALYSHFIAAARQIGSNFCGVEEGKQKSIVCTKKCLAGTAGYKGADIQYASSELRNSTLHRA